MYIGVNSTLYGTIKLLLLLLLQAKSKNIQWYWLVTGFNKVFVIRSLSFHLNEVFTFLRLDKKARGRTNIYLLSAEYEVHNGGKLWTEFFPSFYGPSAKRTGHENKEGKNEDP